MGSIATAIPESSSIGNRLGKPTVSKDITAGNAMRAVNTSDRRSTNKRNAMMLAKLGVYVFPSSGKTPLIPRFNKADTSLTVNERNAAIQEFETKHEKAPAHVGATTNVEVIKKTWRVYPDAVPSVACGPSKLVVLDADQKDNGPTLLGAFFEENGGVPAGVPVIPTKSGGKHFIFRDPESKFTNSSGQLKKNCGTDVRGTGGQFVAPGSIREDGKTYGNHDNLIQFLRAYHSNNIPQLPNFIVEAIGTGAEGDTPLSDSDPEIKELLHRLGAEDWPDFEMTFDAGLGKYSLACIRERAPEFGELYDAPGVDRSTNRFNAARFLLGAFPRMTVEEYASFCRSWEGSGDFDDRALVREYVKAKRNPKHVPVNGDAFGAVDDYEDDQPGSKSKPMPFELESDVAASAVLPDWLIEEVIESETLCVFYGPPNAGKSLALLDALYHVAAGKPWRGRDVKQGCVLYVSVEGPNGTARRAKAWRAHHGVADGEKLPLAFIRVDVDLFNDKKAAQSIVEAVGLLEAMTDLPCRAVAIDTVNAVTPGMDENSSADVGVFLRNLRTILAKTSAAVLPVHHTGKDESRGMRGSNALLAKAETTLLVTDGLITTMKMRDGQRGQKFPFEIKIVNLWENEKGKSVGAPVAIERQRGEALGNVGHDTDDDAALTPSDTPADKLVATLRVFRERVEGIAANTGEAVGKIGVTKKEIFAALNKNRRTAGLSELKDPTIVSRLLGRLVDDGEIVKSGDNRRTEYRLS
jgi:hypothetical protein